MKKSLIALFVAAFCIAGFAADSVLIYNYSLNYKRLNVTSRKEKATVGTFSGTFTLDSARVTSDALTGYVIVDACEKCDGNMTASSATNTATVYVVRRSNPKKYYTVDGNFDAAMFGAFSAYLPAASPVPELQSGYDKFTDASLFLDFDLSGAAQTDEVGFAGGKQNVSCDKIQNVGYGRVTKVTTTTTTPGSVGCVETVTTSTNTCYKVYYANGSAVSKLTYAGHCGEFVFDVCDYINDVNVNYVALPGTFTLTLNNALTLRYGADLATAKAYIEDQYALRGVTLW